MTHKELNQLGVKFLRGKCSNGRYKCQTIRTELKSSSNEIPDVVGFYSGSCVIIESKTSKADFNRDKKKLHRDPNKGVGDYRFFLCRDNLITVDDLYDDWGLLHTDGDDVKIIKHPEHRGEDRSRFEDTLVMYSIIRRMEPKKVKEMKAVDVKNDLETTKDQIFKWFIENKETPIEYDEIDDSIRKFMFLLNISPDIHTLYSCEGHQKEDWAYIYFSVNETGWDIFFNKVYPELCIKLKQNQGENPFMTLLTVDITCNQYNGGITIHRRLDTNELTLEDGEIITYSWEGQKDIFWKTMEEVFLKHYVV